MAVKRLLVVSGKGGTGKTTVMSSLAALANRPVLADCDVDAPDLHLLLQPRVEETREYHGLKSPSVNDALCTLCGECREVCRFGAISAEIVVDGTSCEGCSACAIVCPEGAVTMMETVTGEVYSSTTRLGPMAHARLKAGEEASGKLVMEVRGLADDLAIEDGRDLVLIDGPPGIGCPAISALSGVDALLIVAEPTLSGKQGLTRVVELAEHFDIPAVATVNRVDLNPEVTKMIEAWCGERGVRMMQGLPYDEAATGAMIAGRTVVEHGDGPLSLALRGLWEEIEVIMEEV
jgi:MinD superfamily P-loop ATPase